MAQIEASLVTLVCILLFVGIVFWRACYQIAKAIEQGEYERRRFRLMVAEELDRLDKMVAETKQAERRGRNPSQWELRN